MPLVEVDCGPGGPHGQAKLEQHGPVLGVYIGFDEYFDPDNLVRLPELPGRLWAAIVDTGADFSCIDTGVAKQLSLPVVRREKALGVTGTAEFDVYLAQIFIPGLNLILHREFMGAKLSSNGQPYDALLGREFLRHLVMHYDGPKGSVILSIPSEGRLRKIARRFKAVVNRL